MFKVNQRSSRKIKLIKRAPQVVAHHKEGKKERMRIIKLNYSFNAN